MATKHPSLLTKQHVHEKSARYLAMEKLHQVGYIASIDLLNRPNKEICIKLLPFIDK